jgi:hypothetical protein
MKALRQKSKMRETEEYAKTSEEEATHRSRTLNKQRHLSEDNPSHFQVPEV